MAAPLHIFWAGLTVLAAGSAQAAGLDSALGWRDARAAPGVERRSLLDSPPLVGAELEAGFPDGLGFSGVWSPVRWFRIQVTGLTNGAGLGVRAGITASPAIPVTRLVRLLIGLEGGRYFSTDATWLPGIPKTRLLRAVLHDVSYSFASAQLGLDIGAKWLRFIVRGGLSYLDLQLGQPVVEVGGLRMTNSGLFVRGIVPSARVGLTFCLL